MCGCLFLFYPGKLKGTVLKQDVKKVNGWKLGQGASFLKEIASHLLPKWEEDLVNKYRDF